MMLRRVHILALLALALFIAGGNAAAVAPPADEQIRLDELVASVDADRRITPDEQALLEEARGRMLSAPARLGDVRGHWQVDVIRFDAGGIRRGASFQASIDDTADGVLGFARVGDSTAARQLLLPVRGEPQMLAMIGSAMQALMEHDPSEDAPASWREPAAFEQLSGGRLRRLDDGSLLLVLLSSQARFAIYHLSQLPDRPGA